MTRSPTRAALQRAHGLHFRYNNSLAPLGADVLKGAHREREVARPTTMNDLALPHDSPSRVMATARFRRVAPFRDIAPVDHFVRLFGIAVGEL